MAVPEAVKRRKSIAVAVTGNKQLVAPKPKRRHHSMVGGDRLSPLAKARRSLVPRKSILKTALNFSAQDDDPTASQQNQASSQVSHADETNATQSMDITRDFQTEIRDNTTRKSLARRVSFAEHAHVRLFNSAQNKTDSTESPPSSPAPSSEDRPTDENDYPGSTAIKRRRSSIRRSMDGEESMDLTQIGPSAFAMASESALEDDYDYDEDDEYGEDMEITEAIQGNIIRKRSLSMGHRQPLATVIASEPTPHEEDPDNSQQSFASIDVSQTQSDIDPNLSQPMEFTVPLSQSLRPPAHEDEAWMALREVTHSGDTPYDPATDNAGDDMDIDDAVARLLHARSSFPLPQPPEGADGYVLEDDTFSSMEESFGEQNDRDHGDRTMNLSKVLGTASANTRMSMGYPDSTMEATEMYGGVMDSAAPPSFEPPESQSTPKAPAKTIPTVFRPPPVFKPAPSSPSKASVPERQATVPKPFSFTPKAPKPAAPPTPSKTAKPQFSAAFAPPVTRPSPKKPVTPSSSSSSSPPKKRPRDNDGNDIENMHVEKTSPAQRFTGNITGKWPATSNTNTPTTVETADSQTPKPRPLSPSKKAPFQATSDSDTAPTPTARRASVSTSLRRPSGYFAQRKSMGGGVIGKHPSGPVLPDDGTAATGRSSPKKKAGLGLGLGRVSMGSGAPDAWNRFDKSAIGVDLKGKGKEREHGMEDEVASTQGLARSTSPRAQHAATSSDIATQLQPVDISEFLSTGPGGFGDDVEMGVDPTEQWRDGVQEQNFAEDEDEGPPISIEQFFDITGIRFMDELAAPRRSTHPSQHPSRHPRAPEQIPLAEYFTAMSIDVPQLELYTHVSKDLQAWMEKSKDVFKQAEEEAEKVTPELFREYSQAGEEGQAELLHQLELIRTNTRRLAKSEWYDWKLQWVQNLHDTAEEGFRDLEADAKVLEDINQRAEELLPALQEEYDQVMRDLEREEAEVAEIEGTDQEYLNELKASIAEQNVEVEALRAEVSESNAQLGWLQERLEEIELQKREATTAISEANRFLNIQKNSTRVEVLRLKAELETLEDLHMFRATKVHANLFEYVHASQLVVSIPCDNYKPIIPKMHIKRLDKTKSKMKDDYPRLSDFLLLMARECVIHTETLTIRQVIHRLADYWSSCAQLRSQLRFLSLRYPLEVDISPPSQDGLPAFKAIATVLFPSKKAKANVAYVFEQDTFSHWPKSIASLRCEVDVAYGPLNRQTIFDSVTGRLRQASPTDNYACLLDACIEAQDSHSSS